MPGGPKIVLHRGQPTSGLRRLADPNDSFGSPYWAFPWPGGQALARHVLDHPAAVAGRRVLDLGAGGGIVAVAAAKAGASQVIAAETDTYGLAALALNAVANGVTLEMVPDDLLDVALPAVDLVLVGDLFYERRLARRVTAFLDRCRAAGIAALVGDMGRAFLPRDRLQPVATYPVLEVGGHPTRLMPAHVFTFKA